MGRQRSRAVLLKTVSFRLKLHNTKSVSRHGFAQKSSSSPSLALVIYFIVTRLKSSWSGVRLLFRIPNEWLLSVVQCLP